MVQDATGMWETTPAPGSMAPGSVGPGELPQPRVERRAEPWAVGVSAGSRRPEHPTGQVVDVVA